VRSWGWSGAGFEGGDWAGGDARGCREQGTGKGGAGGVRERMATPIHAMRPHEWGSRNDFVGGPPLFQVYTWAIRFIKEN
jgi:hypothetical protein